MAARLHAASLGNPVSHTLQCGLTGAKRLPPPPPLPQATHLPITLPSSSLKKDKELKHSVGILPKCHAFGCKEGGLVGCVVACACYHVPSWCLGTMARACPRARSHSGSPGGCNYCRLIHAVVVVTSVSLGGFVDVG